MSINDDLMEFSQLQGNESLSHIQGFDFPKDALAFFRKYKEGINDYIWFIDPYSEEWLDMVQEQREVYESVKAGFEQDSLSCGYVQRDNEGYPFDFYPNTGGLIPWAYCDNGTVFYWKPDNDKMTIIVYGDGFEFYAFPFSTTVFLYKLINKSIDTMDSFLPDDLFDYEVIIK